MITSHGFYSATDFGFLVFGFVDVWIFREGELNMVKAIALYTRSHHVWPWHLANLQKTRKGSYVYLILNTSKF